jgi:hypothetical protein
LDFASAAAIEGRLSDGGDLKLQLGYSVTLESVLNVVVLHHKGAIASPFVVAAILRGLGLMGPPVGAFDPYGYTATIGGSRIGKRQHFDPFVTRLEQFATCMGDFGLKSSEVLDLPNGHGRVDAVTIFSGLNSEDQQPTCRICECTQVLGKCPAIILG